MRRLWVLLGGLCLTAMVAPPALAHQIALKSGRVVQFERYRVTETLLFYTDSSGKEVKIALADIDLDRTRDLSVPDNPPLDLPGLSHSNPKGSNAASQSLGDAARSVRKKDASTALKRVFTDDDVASARFEGGASSGRTSCDKPETVLRTMSKFFDMDRVTLGQAVLRMANIDVHTPFPERSEWEFSLFDAKQKMARETLQAEAHPNDVQEQKLAEKKLNAFDAIADRGIQQARDYAKYHHQQ